MPTGLPRIPGHEIIGCPRTRKSSKWAIESVVDGTEDIVAMGLTPNAPFQCLSCRRGDFVTCANQVINGISVDGGYAEFFLARFAQFRASGYKTVALSQNDSKAQLAKELGADIYLDASKVDQVEELNKLGGAKVIIAVAPSGKAMAELIPALSVGSQLVLLAVPHDGLTVNAMHLIQKRRSIVGWPSGTAQDSEETIAFAEHAGVKTSIEKFSLDQVQEGFDRMSENKVRFRAVLTF
ncbi:hypothetical protein MVLG_07111 [Microbotryum lychnidis-dioicae p1A1 Lamole]|uniref:Alcohol dehydrogenase-like C-terminal domain-containing protein n=1 Tax=Microbotryum lychnidis-dioicae (strain p1A1 Lamole / MvSl-1064) TaxID=683840 RepID=U5HJC5_USTV1|nr:hypothetical protein MVLG_07111 [Microbotryum lychnidis-dioicae p1A1 Lamole]|eukprot:KDE02329.1 hypothetical protein MVLG_07111 [Microbotryum lychnidis-dioicae p1A1 Lamole]